MNTPLVCIIAPVYNAEKYLSTSVESVIQQDYKNWRLILVNDCSTDKSDIICRKLQQEDNRIVYLPQKKNRGPAHTRNVGIDEAINIGADYLAFIDSDDTYCTAFLSTMLHTAIEHHADIVWCNIRETKYGKEESSNNVNHDLPINVAADYKQLIKCFFENRNGLGSMVNKLYSTSFITQNKLRINEERVRAEDWEFNLIAFQCNPIVIPIEDALYNYIRHTLPSVTSTYRENDYEMFWRSRELQIEAANRIGINYDHDDFDSQMMYHIIDHLKSLKNSDMSYVKERYNYILGDSRLRFFLSSQTNKTRLLPKSYILLYWALKFNSYRMVKFLRLWK